MGRGAEFLNCTGESYLITGSDRVQDAAGLAEYEQTSGYAWVTGTVWILNEESVSALNSENQRCDEIITRRIVYIRIRR